MEQRRLGDSGLSVSVLSFGTMTIGGRDRFGKMGNLDVDDTSASSTSAATPVSRPSIRRTSTRSAAPRRSSARRSHGRRDDFVLVTKALHAHRARGPHDIGLSRKHLIAGLRGQPAPPAHRLPRPLHLPRAGHVRARRGDAPRLRGPRPPGQGPLHRLLESLGLARDEGAGRRPIGSALSRYICQQVNYSLVARDVEHEIVPLALDQCGRPDGVEPAARGAADRQVPARRRGPR